MWPLKAQKRKYWWQSSFVTHLCHPYLDISFLSLLPGTAEGGWRWQRCVTLTLPHRLFFEFFLEILRPKGFKEVATEVSKNQNVFPFPIRVAKMCHKATLPPIFPFLGPLEATNLGEWGQKLKFRCAVICQYFFQIFKRLLLQVKPRL